MAAQPGAHPIVQIILQHRKIDKLLEFVNGLKQQADLQAGAAASGRAGAAASWGASAAAGASRGAWGGGRGSGKGGGGLDAWEGLVRLRAEFMQTATATGRLSMEEPSLQVRTLPGVSLFGAGARAGGERHVCCSHRECIAPQLAPSRATVRPYLLTASAWTPAPQTIPKPAAFKRLASLATQAAGGGEGEAAPKEVTEVCNIRAAFVAGPGRAMISADYAQVEFRLMAHFSGGRLGRAARGIQGARFELSRSCTPVACCAATRRASHAFTCTLGFRTPPGDPTLLACFAAGQDPFVQLASNWLGVESSQVGPCILSGVT